MLTIELTISQLQSLQSRSRQQVSMTLDRHQMISKENKMSADSLDDHDDAAAVLNSKKVHTLTHVLKCACSDVSN